MCISSIQNPIGTPLSSSYQLRLEVKLSCLGYILIPELDTFISTAYYKALLSLIFLSSLVPG